MPDQALTNSEIVAAYRERTPGSEREAARAADLTGFPPLIVAGEAQPFGPPSA